MSPDKQTLAVYDERAADYAGFTASAVEKTALTAFISACPAQGRVLDLGCGPGRAAGAMQRAGLRVDASDAAPEMVRMARAHPGVTVRQATFDDLDAHDLYDGIWASFSLLHAAQSALPGHLAAIARALRPGGILMLGMKLGSGEKRDSLGRLYAYYSEAELDRHLRSAGLRPDEHTRWQGKGMTGTPEPYIMITAHA
jgi:SAM-dependent methyltransferase